MSNRIPSEFLCPISMELMEDPVLCADGQTYERKHIMEWLQRSPTSPITRQPLDARMIHPNYALKSSITRWKADSNRPPLPSPAKATKNPSYGQPPYLTIPYTPPPMYNQTAQNYMTIVPAPPSPVITTASSQQLTRYEHNRRILLYFGCFLIFFVAIFSAIMSSTNENSHTQDDDDN